MKEQREDPAAALEFIKRPINLGWPAALPRGRRGSHCFT